VKNRFPFVLLGTLAAFACSSGGNNGEGTGGTGPGSGHGGASVAGTTGTAGSGPAGAGGSVTSSGNGGSGVAGTTGVAGGAAGATGGSAAGAPGNGGHGGGNGGSIGGGTGGSSTGAAGAASAGHGGGAAGAGAGGSPSGSGGSTSCSPGRALSLSANGTGSASDSALAHVEIDMKTDLPIGNSQRTIEFWLFIKTTDWVGDKNEVYYYGGSGSEGQFGLDFGTNPVMGMSSNHATLDPFTAGTFSSDSTNDLGINSSTDQWVHVAMVWNGTTLITYVNGLPKIMNTGSGGAVLATGQSVLDIGCNPTNNQCFNGLVDEFRVWNVARTATQIKDSYNKPMAGNEAGLVGYWKFDETSGTTTADSVTTSGHTAHAGTLKADTTAHDPTFVTPPMALPLVCN
jgi:hypothetical protein